MSSAPLTPEGAPLTKEEQATVARLFSDPFYFPLQYKTWLQWFIETVISGGNIVSAAALSTPVPVGGILFTASDRLPGGYLWTNGAAYSRVTYDTLFREIGTRYGVGDGGTTFNVPDCMGRYIVGVGPHPEVNGAGKTELLPAGSRTPRHGHDGYQDPHSHGPSRGAWLTQDGADAPDRHWAFDLAAFTDGYITRTDQQQPGIHVGAAYPANNTGAFLTLNGMIRYV